MKADGLVDLSSPQPEKQLETVARVQDPVNPAPLPPLVEHDDIQDGDDLDESNESDDDEDDEIEESALTEELERAEFEPYTDDGKFAKFTMSPFPLFRQG